MGQSLAKLVTHIIFSTKHRQPLIVQDFKERLCSYFIGILRELQSPTILVNALPDHVHILCCLSKNHALADVLREIKAGTSKWLKTLSPDMADFAWQSGYGAFSVSESSIARVRTYIATQEVHHQQKTFQEEFREFLIRHNVPFDERYVWD